MKALEVKLDGLQLKLEKVKSTESQEIKEVEEDAFF